MICSLFGLEQGQLTHWLLPLGNQIQINFEKTAQEKQTLKLSPSSNATFYICYTTVLTISHKPEKNTCLRFRKDHSQTAKKHSFIGILMRSIFSFSLVWCGLYIYRWTSYIKATSWNIEVRASWLWIRLKPSRSSLLSLIHVPIPVVNNFLQKSLFI